MIIDAPNTKTKARIVAASSHGRGSCLDARLLSRYFYWTLTRYERGMFSGSKDSMWPNVPRKLHARDSLRIARALRVDAPMCHPHLCRCGHRMDELVIHKL